MDIVLTILIFVLFRIIIDLKNKNNKLFIVKNDRKILTLYDSTQEYYNIMGFVRVKEVIDQEKVEKGEFNFTSKIKAVKKYELIKFNKRAKNRDWISKSIIPYHEITFDVEKGVSDLYFGYETYQFPNRVLQIK